MSITLSTISYEKSADTTRKCHHTPANQATANRTEYPRWVWTTTAKRAAAVGAWSCKVERANTQKRSVGSASRIVGTREGKQDYCCPWCQPSYPTSHTVSYPLGGKMNRKITTFNTHYQFNSYCVVSLGLHPSLLQHLFGFSYLGFGVEHGFLYTAGRVSRMLPASICLLFSCCTGISTFLCQSSDVAAVL
jgi:hypothetical protein